MCYLLPVAKFLANWPFLELCWTGLVPYKRLPGDSFGGQPKQGFYTLLLPDDLPAAQLTSHTYTRLKNNYYNIRVDYTDLSIICY